ncbi:MAG: tRNA preQ1(34) S-adenosylmethionine ribosyltransferase-isomerase QueA [Steroidobacteraceae bacterium]|jgi:S-adenosylmethionine:tRNA ribosyltransferase-isomerase
MRRTDFHFELPPELIAQRPAQERSASRLLVLDGATGALEDRRFRDVPGLLTPKDLLVFNDTRVVPARIHGVKDSGGKIEILLERVLDPTTALVQARASKGLRPAARVMLPGGASAHMLGREGDLFRLQFSCEVLPYFEAHGEMPLPPYVDRAPDAADRERYQTVYAREPGAVAAPTAGLHFDAPTFAALAARGVPHASVTLHVGAGTFQPVRVADLEQHVMHEEYLRVPQATADAINATRAAGGRVVAVGTTVVRSLETAAAAAVDAAALDAAAVDAAARDAAARDAAARNAAAPARAAPVGGPCTRLVPYQGATRLFIKPGFRFRVVDAMLTNFHLPESTLLMLCAAFVGREALLGAYAHAVAARYRFFSYGDAMFLTPMPAALERA